MPVRLDKLPLPLHDYMNFKQMASGNEILLNLDNCDNLRNGELVGGLVELSRRDADGEFDWNTHAITAKSLKELKKRMGKLNSKQMIQTALLLQRLRIVDSEAWQSASRHSLRLLHKYKGRDMAQLLDLFDKDILDEEGEPHLLRKTDSDFFERIVGILPIHIKTLSREQLVRTLEVIVKRGIGSDRLFRDYLLLKLERNVMKLSVEQYCRMLRALADK